MRCSPTSALNRRYLFTFFWEVETLVHLPGRISSTTTRASSYRSTMSAEFPKHPFLLSVSETAEALGTDIEDGLLTKSVTDLQQKYPRNELDVGGAVSWYTILSKQVLNAMILVSSPRIFCSWY